MAAIIGKATRGGCGVKVYHDLVLSALAEVSDEVYQPRVWLGFGEGEISPLTECICNLFDDSCLDVALDQGDGFMDRKSTMGCDSWALCSVESTMIARLKKSLRTPRCPMLAASAPSCSNG